MTEAIESHVQTYYTRCGISVKSRGERSIVLGLPADCPDASDLIVDLVSEFSCTVDFTLNGTEPLLTVWVVEKKQYRQLQSSNYLLWLVVCFLFFASFFLFAALR